MKMTAHGKTDDAEFSFSIKHCHLSVALHVVISPEALRFEEAADLDNSQLMSAVCLDVAQAVVGQIVPSIAQLHEKCLTELERSELENCRYRPPSVSPVATD